MYLAAMINSEIALYDEPAKAVEAMTGILKAQLAEDNQQPEWYDISLTKHDSGMSMTADFNQSKKDYHEVQERGAVECACKNT